MILDDEVSSSGYQHSPPTDVAISGEGIRDRIFFAPAILVRIAGVSQLGRGFDCGGRGAWVIPAVHQERKSRQIRFDTSIEGRTLVLTPWQTMVGAGAD